MASKSLMNAHYRQHDVLLPVSVAATSVRLHGVQSSSGRDTVTGQPGVDINRLIANAAPDWQAQFTLHGENAPGHAIVSQIAALIGGDASSIVHVEAQIGRARELNQIELSVLVFTADLIVHTTREIGEDPSTTLIPRASLKAARLVSSPIVTFRQLGGNWRPFVVDLSYPKLELRLPFDESSRDASAAVGALLPSLIADLKANS